MSAEGTMPMSREQVTLTLDGELLHELRTLTGTSDVTATIDEAIASHIRWLKQLRTADEWLEELREPGER